MGSLYIIATPIGNMQDITYRAVEILKKVDVIACEDTRRTRKLLNAYSISGKLISIRSQNEAESVKGIVSLLDAGEDVAFVSDAGTPGLSDPGNVLVDGIRQHKHPIVPVPGVSALTTLFSVAGTGAKGFFFEGFLSPKKGRRRKRLTVLLDRRENFILYESPYRIIKLFEDLADLSPERYCLVGREMTKSFEEYLDGTAKDLYHYYEGQNKILGEFTVLVFGMKNG